MDIIRSTTPALDLNLSSPLSSYSFRKAAPSGDLIIVEIFIKNISSDASHKGKKEEPN